MANPDVAVRIHGLRELQRDLKKIDKALPKDLRGSLKDAIQDEVVPLAKAFAPRRSGRLMSQIKAGASGNKGYVRVPASVPYANAQHWGGTVGPKKTSRIKGTLFATRAIELRHNEIVDRIGDSIEKLAKSNGWD